MQHNAERIGELVRALASQRAHAASAGSFLVGLIGRGIQASRTPGMHEREGARLGLDYCYRLLDFDRMELADEALPQVLRAVADAGFAGVNVTHPFKQAVLPLLDALAPEAAAIGAVNTVVFAGGRATGHNTDSWGFAESFREGMAGCRTGRVVQFGAGGGGAAVAYALMELGVADLALVDTDAGRAAALAEAMVRRFGPRVRVGSVADLAAADGLVNCTPIGMAKYPGAPFPLELLSARNWVAEIVYFPAETELLRHARAIGCRVLPGRGMAVYQAVRAFELFTGRAPDRAAMSAHFEVAA